MSAYEIVQTVLSVTSLFVLGYLSFRATVANEKLTVLQNNLLLKDIPRLKLIVRSISDNVKELTLFNTGGAPVFISYLRVRVDGQGGDWLSVSNGSPISKIDDSSYGNFSVRTGEMLRFEFGSSGRAGYYGVDVILNNLKGDTTSLYFDTTTVKAQELSSSFLQG